MHLRRAFACATRVLPCVRGARIIMARGHGGFESRTDVSRDDMWFARRLNDGDMFCPLSRRALLGGQANSLTFPDLLCRRLFARWYAPFREPRICQDTDPPTQVTSFENACLAASHPFENPRARTDRGTACPGGPKILTPHTHERILGV
jgi:hypothetical protein